MHHRDAMMDHLAEAHTRLAHHLAYCGQRLAAPSGPEMDIRLTQKALVQALRNLAGRGGDLHSRHVVEAARRWLVAADMLHLYVTDGAWPYRRDEFHAIMNGADGADGVTGLLGRADRVLERLSGGGRRR